MKTFNKYKFIQDLQSQIIDDIKSGNIESYYTFIHEYIEITCIYYSDCFDICKELNATDFMAYKFKCNNIYDLAYSALYEYAINELDLNKFDSLLENINA